MADSIKILTESGIKALHGTPGPSRLARMFPLMGKGKVSKPDNRG